MQYDSSKPEDLDSDLEDHAMDEIRYMCMYRPIVVNVPMSRLSAEEAWRKEFNAANILKKIKQNDKKS